VWAEFILSSVYKGFFNVSRFISMGFKVGIRLAMEGGKLVEKPAGRKNEQLI
jgi:predicted peroxiredoxin